MLDHDRIAAMVGRSNATILDVGANDGADSLALAARFPFGQVFSFEPDPRAVKRFLSRVSHPRIHLTQKAVGRETGRALFHQSGGRTPAASDEQHQAEWPQGWDLSGSIRRPTGHLDIYPWCSFEETIEIELTTLDDWADQHNVRLIDFIWADVQGAEGDLIMGGARQLGLTRFLYVEFSDVEMYEGQVTLAQIRNMLPNFEVVEIFLTDVLLRNRELNV